MTQLLRGDREGDVLEEIAPAIYNKAGARCAGAAALTRGRSRSRSARGRIHVLEEVREGRKAPLIGQRRSTQQQDGEEAEERHRTATRFNFGLANSADNNGISVFPKGKLKNKQG
ncbi:hypothetical protein [Ramlibacter tataouinensis]|uniref:hypothetical protein n=1 Tax=Ramlibacter tataouinensis TaxID=94132 RepID=UPI002AB28AD1|nr:hypothetical protein [Ramlibacter tataouinensis]